MIEEIIKIAKSAGDKILDIYNSKDFKVEIKEDKSPLTEADLASNKIIINALKEISGFPILTEESPVDYKERRNWKTFWLVDPLDGTKNFIARNGEFTINVALIENYRPVMGVIYVPVPDTVYCANLGQGAFKDGLKIYNNSNRTQLIGTDSRFHSTAETMDFFKKNNIKMIKPYGSAVKLGKLAEGEVDVYPRFNGTKEWDTAAGHIIASEAGCKLVDCVTGLELLYNKETIKNNYFVASRNDLSFIQ